MKRTDTWEVVPDMRRSFGKERIQNLKTYKDRIAERKPVRKIKRARNERGAVDVPEEPGNKSDEQVAVRRANASGGYTIENQHEEKRMIGIRVNKTGSGATSEEQLDEWPSTSISI